MYADMSHPAGPQPPTPSANGPGIISPYRPPVMAPMLGSPGMPATAPTTGYPLAGVLPAQVGPRGKPAPHFGPTGR